MSGKQRDVAASQKNHRERLRQRFDKDGLNGFHDYEVIEVLLTFSIPRSNCKDMGKDAVNAFGGVRGVLDAPEEDLKSIVGLGPRSAFTVRFVRALVDRYFHEGMVRGEYTVGNPGSLVDYLKVTMGIEERESFAVVYLNAQNCPTTVETLFEGTLTSSVVYPREVLRKVLERNAASIIFVHNHPSGCVEPSEDDRTITRDLVLAASLMDIRILDHIIIGADSHFSFADHGLMREYAKEAQEFHESRRRTVS
ncbi:MAG: DNA repair protein RadC [Dehalococcoidia bacterium]|nr:DNA repair protein RadC [Dehalococcoidia bacterium]